MDRRLNFKTHITDRKKKALQAFSALKFLLLSNLSFKLKTRIYISILRPILTYGSELFNSNINLAHLERFERYWLRVSQRMWNAEKDELYRVAHITPILEYLEILRPILTYGSELFNSNINLAHLERFERHWLRVSQRMWKDELYRDAHIIPILEYLENCKTRYANSIKDKKFTNLNLPRNLNIHIMRHQITLQELQQT